ncbi:hypothetical protein M407DRAFT_19031 [Tulasnella calospora MUT 4182]|uniref:F-box domain-containing protein n=1 Tax=Tulasnella calospora MUT 4182 TaxID=1051891 RepID=A0A0C3QSN3_9AGAM|nr:hypothetical protein M407DRAFT_19031 [Tulasnella calospora MUT 4182]
MTILRILDDSIATMERSLASSLTTVEAVRLLAQARKERNAQAPINQLPIELLATLFNAAVISPRFVPSDQSHLQRLGTIAKVCSRWSIIVKNTPSLWAVVEPKVSNETLFFLLEQSKKSPLTIMLGRGYNQNRDKGMSRALWAASSRITKKILPEIIRWQTVDVGVEKRHSIIRGLESPAPILEEFNFHLELPWTDGPVDLFRGEAPRLRQLRLSGLPLAWPQNQELFQNLTDLDMNRIWEHGPTLAELLNAIHASPRLQTLTLRDVVFSPNSVMTYPRPMVLKSLKKMSITVFSYLHSQIILSSIHAPALKTLIVVPNGLSASNDPYSFVDISIHHFATSIQACLNDARHLEIVLNLNSIDLRTVTDDPDSGSHFWIRLPHESNAESFDACLPRFIVDTPHNLPVRLQVEGFPLFSPEEFQGLFERLKWVTTIELRPWAMNAGVDELLHVMAFGWVDHGAKRWPFPRLISLRSHIWADPDLLIQLVKQRGGRGVQLDGDLAPCEELPGELPARIASFGMQRLHILLGEPQGDEIEKASGH